MDQSPTVQDASKWLTEFHAAWNAGAASQLAGLFVEDGYWRDLVSFTWNIKTLQGHTQIAEMVNAVHQRVALKNVVTPGLVDLNDPAAGFWFTFETDNIRGKGILKLAANGCTTLLTTAQELIGFEEKSGRRRPQGVEHRSDPDRLTWAEQRAHEHAELGRSAQPYVVIIGGGQGGIALGARLRRLEVPTIIIERNNRPGDSWRNRYKTLCLHDPVWYDHLPYLPFPDHWPVFSPKDKIGDWLESYVMIMELNYWTGSACTKASYDEVAGRWTIEIDRSGEIIELTPTHLVLATGMAGVPNMPEIAGAETFEGDLHHSSQHAGPEDYAGKNVVVVGSNNSAHDICAALWEAGATPTMIQRSSTMVAKSESLMKFGTNRLYSEDALDRGVSTEQADLIMASMPYGAMAANDKKVTDKIRAHDAEFYDRLNKSGFEMDFGADDSGLFMKYMRRGSGYYIDVGASDLIMDGRIGLSHGQIIEIKPNSVLLDDGSELPADALIFATGYGSMNGFAAQLISQDVADKVGKCWGLGSDTIYDPGPWEGEPRNMWKPTQQDALWFHGGNLHQSRHYSQFLALQLKARAAGIDTPVYGLAPVHHLS
jgi:putative flavoprotein involved in K+ transport